MSDVVARAKEALEGITDAPWFQNGRNGVHTERGSCIATTDQQEPFHRRMRDAEFIAEARSLVPDLVAEIDRLKAMEDRVRALHSPVTDITDELVCTGCGVDYGDCPTIAALEAQR